MGDAKLHSDKKVFLISSRHSLFFARLFGALGAESLYEEIRAAAHVTRRQGYGRQGRGVEAESAAAFFAEEMHMAVIVLAFAVAHAQLVARAAVADPPVMILDEATSSIDTRTEAIVQKGMDKLMEGRTSFVIAHRLSTIRKADVILVVDDGRIVESGTHAELIRQPGRYQQFVRIREKAEGWKL